MVYTQLLLLLVSCLAWTTTSIWAQEIISTQNHGNLCSGQAVGFYPDLLNNCKTYLVCLNGRMVWAACPVGTRFDDVSKTCVDEAIASCDGRMNDTPIIIEGNSDHNQAAGTEGNQQQPISVHKGQAMCARKQDGFYPDVSQGCRLYYECVDGALVKEFACQKSMTYDVTRHQCYPDKFVSCELSNESSLKQTTGQDGSGKHETGLWRRLLSKRQIKFGGGALAPGLIKAMGEVLEQLGENMEGHL